MAVAERHGCVAFTVQSWNSSQVSYCEVQASHHHQHLHKTPSQSSLSATNTREAVARKRGRQTGLFCTLFACLWLHQCQFFSRLSMQSTCVPLSPQPHLKNVLWVETLALLLPPPAPLGDVQTFLSVDRENVYVTRRQPRSTSSRPETSSRRRDGRLSV